MGPKHLIHKLLDKLVLCPLQFFTSSSQKSPLSTSALFFTSLLFSLSAGAAVLQLCLVGSSCCLCPDGAKCHSRPSLLPPVCLLSHDISVNHSNHIRILPCLIHVSLRPLWACFLSHPEYKPSFWPLLLYLWNCFHSLKVISADV